NGACLVKNKYKHESSCPGPRRKFYAFHRIILNCVAVHTKCPRMYKHNEYPSLKQCQSDCAWHMHIDLPANQTDNATASGGSGNAGAGAPPPPGAPAGG
ncbi:hypothetical protein KR222_002178, partial [Zaprionus bogoriensis]